MKLDRSVVRSKAGCAAVGCNGERWMETSCPVSPSDSLLSAMTQTGNADPCLWVCSRTVSWTTLRNCRSRPLALIFAFISLLMLCFPPSGWVGCLWRPAAAGRL